MARRPRPVQGGVLPSAARRRAESPITRTTKKYGLSAPRCMARLTYRGGYDGVPNLYDQVGYAQRMDSFIADLEGGLNVAAFHDFRRSQPLRQLSVRAALETMSVAMAGLISFRGRGLSRRAAAVMADASGAAIIGIRPHVSAVIVAGRIRTWPITCRFELVGEDVC